jgi:hypothetical protein
VLVLGFISTVATGGGGGGGGGNGGAAPAAPAGGGGNGGGGGGSSVPNQAPNVALRGTITETTDVDNHIKLLGELRNTSVKIATFVRILFVFYNADNEVVGEGTAYVYGSCWTIVLIDSETGSCLAPNEVGAFELYTDIPDVDVASYTYEIQFDDYNVRTPDANLEIDGPIEETELLWGALEFSGQVINTGTEDLIFGMVCFALRNAQGSIQDTTLCFIDGVTVYLPTIDDFTDTALYVNGSGTFSTIPTTDYEGYQNYYYKTSWRDAVIENGAVTSSLQTTASQETKTEEQLSKDRNQRLDQLRQASQQNRVESH